MDLVSLGDFEARTDSVGLPKGVKSNGDAALECKSLSAIETYQACMQVFWLLVTQSFDWVHVCRLVSWVHPKHDAYGDRDAKCDDNGSQAG